MYSEQDIRECYLLLLSLKAKRQKDLLDGLARKYKIDSLSKAEFFKEKVYENAKKQIDVIDKNTSFFINQLNSEVERKKSEIDNILGQKQETVSLSLEDVKLILNLLEHQHK